MCSNDLPALTLFFLQELDDIRKSGLKIFRNIRVDDSNILLWQGLIVPVSLRALRAAKVKMVVCVCVLT